MWIILGVLGALAVITYLRVLAIYCYQNLETHRTARQVAMVRAEYQRLLDIGERPEVASKGIQESDLMQSYD